MTDKELEERVKKLEEEVKRLKTTIARLSIQGSPKGTRLEDAIGTDFSGKPLTPKVIK